MCADGWEIEPDQRLGETWGECPECGERVVIDASGDMSASTGCNYSPRQCELCGSAPCDQSC